MYQVFSLSCPRSAPGLKRTSGSAARRFASYVGIARCRFFARAGGAERAAAHGRRLVRALAQAPARRPLRARLRWLLHRHGRRRAPGARAIEAGPSSQTRARAQNAGMAPVAYKKTKAGHDYFSSEKRVSTASFFRERARRFWTTTEQHALAGPRRSTRQCRQRRRCVRARAARRLTRARSSRRRNTKKSSTRTPSEAPPPRFLRFNLSALLLRARPARAYVQKAS